MPIDRDAIPQLANTIAPSANSRENDCDDPCESQRATVMLHSQKASPIKIADAIAELCPQWAATLCGPGWLAKRQIATSNHDCALKTQEQLSFNRNDCDQCKSRL